MPNNAWDIFRAIIAKHYDGQDHVSETKKGGQSGRKQEEEC